MDFSVQHGMTVGRKTFFLEEKSVLLGFVSEYKLNGFLKVIRLLEQFN